MLKHPVAISSIPVGAVHYNVLVHYLKERTRFRFFIRSCL